MKTDSYTKVILTVIAVALVALVLQNMNIVSTVQANNSSAPKLSPQTIIDTPTMNVNIVSVNGKELKVDHNGNLKVSVSEMPKVKLDNGFGGLEVKVSNYSDFR